jgi:hypothetical protein
MENGKLKCKTNAKREGGRDKKSALGVQIRQIVRGGKFIFARKGMFFRAKI